MPGLNTGMRSIDEDANDSSNSNTMPDISLGSLEDSFKSPPPLKQLGRFTRPPGQSSTSSTASTRVKTPSPTRKGLARLPSQDKTPKPKRGGAYFDDKDDEDDTAATTDAERRWQSDSMPPRHKRTRSSIGITKPGAVNMTLREQEKVSARDR